MAAYVDIEKPHADVRRAVERMEKMPLEVVTDLTIEDRPVWLDGRLWRRCIFRNCEIFMMAGAWNLEECRFLGCQMSFVSGGGQIAEMMRRLA